MTASPAPAPAVQTPAPDVVSVRGITKTYGGTAALRDVSLDVRPGEVHALLGCNGSGKSTLIKVLAGIARADDGTVTVRGTQLAASDLSPGVAHRQGLRFVHQTPVVFEALTVADNLAVTDGFPHGWVGSVDSRELRRRAEQAIERFGLDVAPGAPVATLRPAQRVMLSIARALDGTDEGRSCLVVLDEPTAVLQGADCDEVLGWMRQLAQEGHGVVFVSHRLDEVRQVCDRATVLRDGQVSGVVDGDLTRARVLDLMVGDVGEEVGRSRSVRPPGEVVLQVRDLSSGPLQGVTLQVRRGEVVGVAGLVGSGRTTLLETIYGARSPREGHIDLVGRSQRPRSPRSALAAGIAYVPEDREAAGIFPGLGVRDNLLVPSWSAFRRRLRMDDRGARRATAAAITDFGVVCADDSAAIASLSGGNQQKVVIARWIRMNPLLVLLDEPTQGVDVSARAGIHAIVREFVASDGAAALVVSSDHDELVELCDRVVVIADGVVVSEVSGDDLTASHLTRLTHSTKEDR